MSVDRNSARKRKVSDVIDLHSENVGFPPKLKPVVTARPCRPASNCNERVLELKANATADIEGEVDFVLPTEHVDAATLGSYLSTENVDATVNSKNLTEGDEGCETSKSEEHRLTDSEEGCETPKSEEHRIPKILACPPAPRKPRPTARRKTESAAALSRALFVDSSNFNLLFFLQPKKG